MKGSLVLLLLSFAGLAACGDAQEATSTSSGDTTGVAGPSGAGGGASTSSSSTTSASQGSGGASPTSISGDIAADTTLSGDVDMTAKATVAAGVTLTLSAGTTLHAFAGASLVVSGTLIAQGTSASRVTLESKPHAGQNGWAGLSLDGGTANLSYVTIHDAATALDAAAGSSYTIDHLDVDTSTMLLKLAADGSIDHGTMHGLGDMQPSDPIVVNGASPHLSNLLLDGLSTYTDYVQLNGGSPVFDHMEVTSCHCAFHFNSGTGATISNSYLHDDQYGLMVIGSTSTKVLSSNFQNNAVNIGTCSGGSVTATGVYFDDGAFDGTCAGQTNQSPASAPLSSVGPVN